MDTQKYLSFCTYLLFSTFLPKCSKKSILTHTKPSEKRVVAFANSFLKYGYRSGDKDNENIFSHKFELNHFLFRSMNYFQNPNPTLDPTFKSFQKKTLSEVFSVFKAINNLRIIYNAMYTYTYICIDIHTHHS